MRRALALLLTLLLPLGLAQEPPTWGFRVVNTFPHDPNAFTQGLIFLNGFLYEGTGLNGRSSIRQVELRTGRVLRQRNLEQRYFGEGITFFQNRFYQLTWQNREGFIYDLNFNPVGKFTYETEGWGLTHNGRQLILSDGSPNLYFLDPRTLKPVRTLRVTANGEPVEELNELEFINGRVWANVWQTNRIAIINPETGRVEAWLDLAALTLLVRPTDPNAVLNGIAYDVRGNRIFVTGKLWPSIFEITVTR
ncbi:MAG: glutaminyl-peptide cyclotransferase [Meiothermus sp.]|nr:glutaminyl-peptide cyclotransferase [Meiothermus sp.]